MEAFISYLKSLHIDPKQMKANKKELGEDVLKIIDKTEQIEQMIINVDAKYKIKLKNF